MTGEEAPCQSKSTNMGTDDEGFTQVSSKKSCKIQLNIVNNDKPTTSVNPYGLLESNDDELCSEKGANIPKRTVKIPPIIVKSKINFTGLVSRVRELLGHNEFSCTYGQQHRIYVKTLEDHKKIMQDLQQMNIEHHTFARADQKVKKIVMKAAPGMDHGELTKEIEILTKKAPTDIISMNSKKNKDSHSYLVTFNQEMDMNKIKNITGLNNIRVKWETYSKKQRITQCHRCQEYGHGQIYCYSKPRCLKCGGQHLTKECMKCTEENFKPRCCNCGGQHVANYSQCQAAMAYIEKIERSQLRRQETVPRKFDARASLVRGNINYSMAAGNRQQQGQQQ